MINYSGFFDSLSPSLDISPTNSSPYFSQNPGGIQLSALDLIQMAEEELVDPKQYLEDRCKPKCVKPLYDYQECAKRVDKDETGHKHCTGQYFDFWSCIDKCAAGKLFESLK